MTVHCALIFYKLNPIKGILANLKDRYNLIMGGWGMEYIGYFVVAIILILIVVKLLSWPLKILIKLIINGILGAILLFIVNIFGSYFGFQIGINIVTALIAGVLGVPGVIFLIIFKLFF